MVVSLIEKELEKDLEIDRLKLIYFDINEPVLADIYNLLDLTKKGSFHYKDLRRLFNNKLSV